jgi:hypothetical protein
MCYSLALSAHIWFQLSAFLQILKSSYLHTIANLHTVAVSSYNAPIVHLDTAKLLAILYKLSYTKHDMTINMMRTYYFMYVDTRTVSRYYGALAKRVYVGIIINQMSRFVRDD